MLKYLVGLFLSLDNAAYFAMPWQMSCDPDEYCFLPHRVSHAVFFSTNVAFGYSSCLGTMWAETKRQDIWVEQKIDQAIDWSNAIIPDSPWRCPWLQMLFYQHNIEECSGQTLSLSDGFTRQHMVLNSSLMFYDSFFKFYLLLKLTCYFFTGRTLTLTHSAKSPRFLSISISIVVSSLQ